MQLPAMLEVELPEELPAAWLAGPEARAGRPFTPLLHGDEPFAVDEATRSRADAQAHETIDAARDLLGLRTR